MVAVERFILYCTKYFLKDLAFLERLYQNITSNDDVDASNGDVRPDAILLLPMKGYKVQRYGGLSERGINRPIGGFDRVV